MLLQRRGSAERGADRGALVQVAGPGQGAVQPTAGQNVEVSRSLSLSLFYFFSFDGGDCLVFGLGPFRDSGFAEKLFQDMEEKTGQAYSALICGMASHGQAEGAWEHYKRMTRKWQRRGFDWHRRRLGRVGCSRVRLG